VLRRCPWSYAGYLGKLNSDSSVLVGDSRASRLLERGKSKTPPSHVATAWQGYLVVTDVEPKSGLL